MRILWHSNSPTCSTGYGQQTALFLPLIAEDYEVAVSANFGAGVGSKTWNGIEVLPNGVDSYGNGFLPSHASYFFQDEPGMILTLFDVWTFEKVQLQGQKLASWTPVDHDPVPSSVVHFFRQFNGQAIAMSRFGQKALGEYGIEAHYVPHGFNAEDFKPIDRALARKVLNGYCGVPEDGYLVGMVAANKGNQPPRKGFPEAFLAFRKFKDKHKDAVLYLHTERFGNQMGCKLDAMALACGLEPDVDVFFPPQYPYAMGMPNVFVNGVYNALDVLLNPAYGEGFGVPIIEAQAAGTPVIVNDFTSMPELCGAGWLVQGEPFWDEPQMSFFKKPSVQSIANALEKAYRSGDRKRQEATEFAQRYSHRTVYEQHMKPTLDSLVESFTETPKPVNLAAV